MTGSVPAHTVESSATNRASRQREDCMMRRPITAAFLAIVASLAIASAALATECTNVSKSDPAAGAQALIDANTGEILWMTEGLANRLAQGVVDPDTSEGFHGLVAFDLNSDGSADFSTWINVGPDGESFCSASGVPAGYDGDFDPAPNNVGEFVAWIAQNVGNSGAYTPGNAQDPAPPFVPFVIDCNPTAP